MGYRIEVVTDECMSSGKCVADFPASFDFDDDELAVLVENGAAMSDEDMIKAARNCPSRALQVLDASGDSVET